MKLFYKKYYKRAMVELEHLKEDYRLLQQKYKKLEIRFNITDRDLNDVLIVNKTLNDEMSSLENKLRKANSAKGGLTKYLNVLIKKNQDES